jgi:hypothetical protein
VTRYPLFREALDKWSRASVLVLRQALADPDNVISFPMEQWRLDQDGHFRPHHDSLHWSHDTLEKLNGSRNGGEL